MIFDKIYEEIKKYEEGIHILNESVNMDELVAFEEKYEMILPHSLEYFLKRNNGGELFAIPVGTCIAGILGNSMRKKGLLYLEDNFNNSIREGLPNNFFFIASSCDGNLIGFDLVRTNKEDGIVVYWDHESDDFSMEWNSLEEWLEYEMESGKELINYDGSDVE